MIPLKLNQITLKWVMKGYLAGFSKTGKEAVLNLCKSEVYDIRNEHTGYEKTTINDVVITQVYGDNVNIQTETLRIEKRLNDIRTGVKIIQNHSRQK